MLESYVEKAELADGMDLLDLGCGWGSLSLFLAEVIRPLHKLIDCRNFRNQKLPVYRTVIHRKCSSIIKLNRKA
jgi:ubiquinone/menaquinone biosynthesis C-methylase UbiE